MADEVFYSQKDKTLSKLGAERDRIEAPGECMQRKKIK